MPLLTPEPKIRRYTPESPLRRPGSFVVEIARDIASARELSWQLFLRDLRANYRQSLLGYLWAVLPPLSWGAIFILLQRRGVIRAGSGEGYAATVLSGMVFWQTFVDALQAPLRGFGQARSLVARVSFPREAVLLSSFLEVAFQFVMRSPLLVWAWWAAGAAIGGHLLSLPLAIFGLIAAGAAIGVAVLPLGLLYQDVRPGLTLVASFWLLATPAAYVGGDGGLGGPAGDWNPVNPLIGYARACLLGTSTDDAGTFALIVIGSALAVVVGWVGFRVALPHAIARLGS